MTATITRHEVQVDTEIARFAAEVNHHEVVIERAEAEIARLTEFAHNAEARIEAARARIVASEHKLDGLRPLLAAANAQYTGWDRYFLVNNSNGHVHWTTGCSTCYVTTEFKWLTDFSGMDRAELVELAGEKCCTVCFPGAPVDRPADSRFRSDDEVAKAERDAEKAAKRAEKAKKALRTDLEPVAIFHFNGNVDEHLKTIVAAENYYAGELSWAASCERYHNEGGRNDSLIAEYTYHAEQALKALAERLGTDVEAQRTRLAAKLAKKIKKDLG